MGYLRLPCYLMCAVFLAPFVALIANAVSSIDVSVWPRFAVELKSAIWTIWTGLCAALFALAIGAATAYHVTFHRVLLRRVVDQSIVLSLLFPTFVLGAVYKELFAASGILVNIIGLPAALTFDFQSTGGFIFIMSLGLLPYVYLLSRISFESYGPLALDLGQTLGLSTARSFAKILSPLALPAVAIGALLVFIETAGEWATASLLSVNTGAVAVQALWFERQVPNVASQLAFLMMAAAFVGVVPLIRSAQHKNAPHIEAMLARPPRATRSTPAPYLKWLRFLFCLTPGLFGFIIPAATVLYYLTGTVGSIDLSELLIDSANTVVLIVVVLLITAVFSVLLSATHCYSPSFASGLALRWLTASYAVPAMVLAVGVLTLLDQVSAIEDRTSDLFSFLVLAMTLSVRFACFLFIPLYIGLTSVSKQVEDVGGALGLSYVHRFSRLHLPLVQRYAMFGLLLLTLQIIKETSISIALHPFSFDTLALKTYAYIDIGLLPESASWIFATALLGLYPLLTIKRMMLKRRPKRS
ncbi:MAG: hypothetical protein QNJ97_00855 [Myxococcota bacterium]|nr:hypothetical protein [Myxococcota bacterium]